MAADDLFLGFDLSTQQIKVIAINSKLEPIIEANVEFDVDTPEYGTKKGVFTNVDLNEVYAPVVMWIKALDILLGKLQKAGLPFDKVKSISGAGQQHGSVYWSKESPGLLENLDPSQPLESQLGAKAFSHEMSPNWQDHSTAEECKLLEDEVGGPNKLAEITGSKSHHRFTGPQIMRVRHRHPDEYEKTDRISLVSSFLASLFLGSIAPFDVSDVCGMNMWDIPNEKWNDSIIQVVAGGDENDKKELLRKLGEVEPDGGKNLGPISNYFVSRYGFSKSCIITPITGDNPATILALPLRPLDVIVSLGTSTTLLVSTPVYKTSPSYHMFSHPTSKGLYMGMLCYCNGALAREKIRDEINKINPPSAEDSWSSFNDAVEAYPPLGSDSDDKLGIYFPLPEIVPDCQAGTWRYVDDHRNGISPVSDNEDWDIPIGDARAILESQNLSMRLRAGPLLSDLGQPRRVYVVGGGSKNPAICKVTGEVLGPSEGVFRLELSNACALGSAYKALWSVERSVIGRDEDSGKDIYESFEDFLGQRWDESTMINKVDVGYRKGVWERYGAALKSFEQLEDIAVNF
ncbi:uncharacterized protein V2V93DRAFT_335265 [Kockiozyma suomiensis]|uniref:uncharacterized protein n=1 Tax=Kockiozyma suomiensis TaxID=1337062 RepID=UPI0033443048